MKNAMLSVMIVGTCFLPIYGQGRIANRQENQQDRIAQGVASGRLSAAETANLEHKEAKLNREIRSDRKANGGSLTPQERQQVNRQQNRLSRNIYRDKHNGKGK